jgi:prepilin-type N-terminal cleavage/methylation domain-containing protein
MSNTRGMTFIELLVATLIVGVVALVLVESFARARLSFDQEERKRAATFLAQEALERAIATDYAFLAGWSEERTIASRSYEIEVTVTDDAPEPGIKTIESSVRWPASPTVERNVSLVTLLYDN